MLKKIITGLLAVFMLVVVGPIRVHGEGEITGPIPPPSVPGPGFGELPEEPVLNGPAKIDGVLRLYENGSMVTGTGWHRSTEFYIYSEYFYGDKCNLDYDWFYVKDGVVQTGSVTVDGKEYFLEWEFGYAESGAVRDDSEYFHFYQSIGNTPPCKVTAGGWVKDEYGFRYYVKEDGSLAYHETLTIDGKKYKFLEDCSLHSGAGYRNLKSPDGQDLEDYDPDAELEDDWYTYSGYTYYVKNGSFLRGVNEIDGVDGYYFDFHTNVLATEEGWYESPLGKYYVGSDSKVKTGWFTVAGKKYYAFPEDTYDSVTGIPYKGYCICDGWAKIDGDWYYMSLGTGEMRTGWITIFGKKYYLNSDGKMVTGVVTIDGKICTFDDRGVLVKEEQPEDSVQIGWGMKDGKKYYIGEDGQKVKGWKEIEGKWYFFDGSGVMQTGWIASGSKWYYMGSDGAMATGWVNAGGTWYYMNGDGSMATGWVKDGDTWYYMSGSGAMVTGWLKQGNTWYYMKSSGAMATGLIMDAGKTYYLDKNGVMRTGWQEVGGTWYFFEGSGAAKTGWIASGSKWYYMGSDGAMATGWVLSGGAWYYMNGDGSMATGWVKDGDTWYYMSGSGAMVSNSWVGNYYLQGDGSMATDKWIGQWYVGADGAWVPDKKK